MALYTVITALLMEFLGLLGFFLSSGKSWTALIPSIFGTLLLVCGILIFLYPTCRRHALHAAAALSLIGFLGSFSRAGRQLPALLSGEPVTPGPLAVILQLLFAALCFVYFAVCFRSFLAARFSRKSASTDSN